MLFGCEWSIIMNSPVPVVDFSSCKLGIVPCPDKVEFRKLVKEIHSALSTIGFVYLTNHGIPEELINQAFETSAKFFHLPVKEKEKYTRPSGQHNHGWSHLGRERFQADIPGDYKEAYDINPTIGKCWPPDSLANGFKSTTLQMYNICRQLGVRILDVMALGLDLEPSFFSDRHNISKPTHTSFRCLYYPAILHKTDIEENQQRCLEHSDYGSLTILFQDDSYGLEVFHKDQGFIPAPHIPGTVLIILGDLMQMWTADKLLATKHRVVNGRKRRQSMVCFIHPDEDCLIECVDDANNYPAIRAKDYMEKRLSETF